MLSRTDIVSIERKLISALTDPVFSMVVVSKVKATRHNSADGNINFSPAATVLTNIGDTPLSMKIFTREHDSRFWKLESGVTSSMPQMSWPTMLTTST